MEVTVESFYEVMKLYFQMFWYIIEKKFPEIVITEVYSVGEKNGILIKLGKHISHNQVNYEQFFCWLSL